MLLYLKEMIFWSSSSPPKVKRETVKVAALEKHNDAGAHKWERLIIFLFRSERGLRVAANPRREVCGGKNVCFGVPIAERRRPQPRPGAPAPRPHLAR